jgi:hypothetical protein
MGIYQLLFDRQFHFHDPFDKRLSAFLAPHDLREVAHPAPICGSREERIRFQSAGDDAVSRGRPPGGIALNFHLDAA